MVTTLDVRDETAFALGLEVFAKRNFEHALSAMLQRGNLDIVVNNAGFRKRMPLDEIVSVNMRSVFLRCQLFSAVTKAAGYGRIVIVTSLALHRGGTVASGSASLCLPKCSLCISILTLGLLLLCS
ncbi:SDR family NAD(P)-dependent oxidoreductase [Paraburkholderia tropica]|uniref:SDR family NAD(P)-dependent oxidoreductase n=1 Tax=Paraburkholderia tropica TaxID=92647 RepID=UPI0038B96F26